METISSNISPLLDFFGETISHECLQHTMPSGQKAGGIYEEAKLPKTQASLDRMGFSTSVTWVPSSKNRSSHKLVPLSPLIRLLLVETPAIALASVMESRLRILASEADVSKGK